MSTGSGLDSQLMFAPETTYGTAVTPTRTLEFNSESLALKPTKQSSSGLHRGIKLMRASRARRSRYTVTGDIEVEIATVGMGMLVAAMLASGVTTTTQIASTTAYKQIHTMGDFRGKSLTVQVGRPEPATGTVQPFTWAGCKVVKWSFVLKDNATPTLTLTFDGRSETTATALATAAYLANSTTYDFSQATLKLGGTAATASGETTITGGTAMSTIIKSITIGGETKMATDRFGVGNAGLKSEPLENDEPTLTGKLDAEFGKTELYDPFVANTAMPLQLDLTGANISGANNFLFSIILTAIKLEDAAPQVKGPDVLAMSTDFGAYSDEVNPPVQVKIVSTETTSV